MPSKKPSHQHRQNLHWSSTEVYLQHFKHRLAVSCLKIIHFLILPILPCLTVPLKYTKPLYTEVAELALPVQLSFFACKYTHRGMNTQHLCKQKVSAPMFTKKQTNSINMVRSNSDFSTNNFPCSLPISDQPWAGRTIFDGRVQFTFHVHSILDSSGKFTNKNAS